MKRVLAGIAAVLLLSTAACGGGSDTVSNPDDPTDLTTEWPAVCDEAFALAERGIESGQDSANVAQGLVDLGQPLFVECTTLVVQDYPPSCLEVVTTMSGMLEAQVKDPTTTIGFGANLIMRRSEALITCDIDHVYDVPEAG